MFYPLSYPQNMAYYSKYPYAKCFFFRFEKKNVVGLMFCKHQPGQIGWL